MTLFSAQVYPNKGLGPLALGASLHDVLHRLKAEPQTYPTIDLSYSSSQPISTPILLGLPANGIRLRFDGPDQRLRLVEILDFSKSRLSYKNVEIVKPSSLSSAATALQPQVSPGPSFRHVYNRLFGPTFPGEYIPPSSQDSEATGTYILSYPGIAFTFSIQASAWSANLDFVALLSSSAASPASSMAVFIGSSWSDARAGIFTLTPPHPRSLSLAGRGREGGADEVEVVKVRGEGCIELVRRFGPPFWIMLSQTTPQDLVAELGPPDAIYRKNDRRLAIHKARSAGSRRSGRVNGMYGGQDESTDTDQSSSHTTTDDSDEDGSATASKSHDITSAECFYNYFHHGFDVFISSPTTPSARSPTSPRAPSLPPSTTKDPSNSTPTACLTATKLLLHANIPGSYPFNRHRRSRWTLEHVPSIQYQEPLNSEMPFNDIASRLREVWKTTYNSEDEEKSLQRGMVLNRGWGDSPGSSCELLGGWEESVGGNRKCTGDLTGDGEQSLGNTELFGYPGLVFEVLKNGAVSCLTVF
ncbi:MAG: hypothetical protein M1813_002331 [Trichoglossum hirsutum]|nr:MAG: hypothetical protein M1813_002331 [Trichoglossum hirsutum]